MLQMTGKGESIPGWTLNELVDETKGKVHLTERDQNAYYECSEVKKMKYEALIAKMRVENKEKRRELATCINGDEKVIKTVFHHRKEELLSMQRYTTQKANNVMDQKVCEASKTLNTLKHEYQTKRETLDELQSELRHMKYINCTEYDQEREQEIRRIQNEMDKAAIKFGAARNITRRYESIMDTLQEDVRNYPRVLDELEGRLEAAVEELTELTKMNEKAIKASEEARKDLHCLEREMYQAKRGRDQKLNETRKEVEKRKETADRTERKMRVNLMNDSSDSRNTRLQMQKAERQEKMLTLEDAFEKIKRALHVSDMDDIVYRLENQGVTYVQLRTMEKLKSKKKKKLSEELTRLRKTFDELKFTSERHTQRGRMVVQEMSEFVLKEEEKCALMQEKCSTNENLLIDLKTGIATLFEKLKEVRLKPPYTNFAKGDPVADLIQCGRKVDLLQSSLGVKKNAIPVLPKTEHVRLHQYLETRLPPDNLRIRIDLDDMSDSDDFHFDHDQENEGFVSREEIKRQGQEILNSKLKPKKKKGRKRST